MALDTQKDTWEQKYALPDELRASVLELQQACSSHTALLVLNSAQPSKKADPKLELAKKESSSNLQLNATRRNASLKNLETLACRSPMVVETQRAQGGLEPIETAGQFLEWYGDVEAQLAEGQDQEVHEFAGLLQDRVGWCGGMLDSTRDIEAWLTRMEQAYEAVCKQTEEVKAACASMQRFRDQLDQVSGAIANQLQVYNWLGFISQLVHGPGDRICLDPEFLPALERTERAIAFIETHPGGMDSELYLMRFAQCRMRALTLIKMHAQREFRTLAQKADADWTSLLYVRYRASCNGLKELLQALQQRAHASSASTDRQILADVQQAYFNSRLSRVRQYIQESLEAIKKEDGMGIVDWVRNWCAAVMNVCVDEHRLFGEFFSDSQPEVHGYLNTAITVFHEYVRPLVIRESKMETLAELSMTLLTYQKSAALMENEKDDGLDAFYAVVDEILQDAQQRLVYKAQTDIRASILGYRIGPGDATAISEWLQCCVDHQCADPEQVVALASSNRLLQWVYPPVDHYRWLAALVESCVDEQVYRGLAEEALAGCKQNLLSQAARHVREVASSQHPDRSAEQLAHLFVTFSLSSVGSPAAGTS